MKKLLFLLVAMIAMITVDAQKAVFTMTGSDTIVNTASVSVSQTYSSEYGNVAFQAVVTKVSGTVAGTVLLQGSLDGTNYVDISTDTLSLTDVATQSKLWSVDANPYKYYRLKGTGSGTMAAIIAGYALARVKD